MATPAQTASRLKKLLSNMPSGFSKGKNFNALLGAIAQSDADLQNLFLDVKKQLFVQTAEGEFLDTLGANVGVSRPPLIGMIDDDFREFIKLQTYYPKQIRQLLFRLMELFYGRDTIKANTKSVAFGPFAVPAVSNLLIEVDGRNTFEVTIKSSSFNDPSSVSAEEIVADINSQASEDFFASTYRNAIDKQDFVEVFTNTFGPSGSIKILGGSANRFLKFPETFNLGATISSVYRLDKVSTSMRLYWAGGDNPQFSQLRLTDYVILTGTPFVAENAGSFLIASINDTGVPALVLGTTQAQFQSPNIVRYFMPSTASILIDNFVTVSGFSNASNNGTFQVSNVTASYVDLITSRTTNADDETATATIDLIPSASFISYENQYGVSEPAFGVSTIDDVLFFRPVKKKLESAQRPATVWEVNSNEIVVTLPATPVVVRRALAGSSHAQGTTAVILRAFTTTADMLDVNAFPLTNGNFYIQRPDGFIDRSTRYTYSVLNGSQLLAISPTVRPSGELLSLGIGPLSTVASSSVITVTTSSSHGLQGGELVRLEDFSGFAGLQDSDINGVFAVSSILSPTSFSITTAATATSTTSNYPSVDKGRIYTVRNSKVVITNVQENNGYVGSFVYDQFRAPYTISETQTTITQSLLQGEFGGSLSVFDSSVFPSDTGQVVINYGRSDEEGPISFIARPGASALFVDPSYRFKKNHSVGAAINLVRSPFATKVSPDGAQYPVYVVDTIGPRAQLETLLLDAKAAGVSVRFVVILPNNLYNAYSLYG